MIVHERTRMQLLHVHISMYVHVEVCACVDFFMNVSRRDLEVVLVVTQYLKLLLTV